MKSSRLHKSNSLADNNHRTEPINLFKKTWIISLTHLSSTKASLPWFKSLFLVCFGLNEKKIILVRHIGTYWNIGFMLFPWWWSDKLVTNPLAFVQKTVTKKYRRIPQSSLNSSRWRKRLEAIGWNIQANRSPPQSLFHQRRLTSVWNVWRVGVALQATVETLYEK